MASVPIVFDRALVRRRLDRAFASGAGDFLLDRTTDDLIERLLTVQRTFRSILDLGTPRSVLADRLAETYQDASVTRIAPIAGWAGASPILRAVADEERAPLKAASFDLAVSLLSLHSVNDLPGVLTQIRQSLKPDGLFMGALFGGQTLQELRQTMTEAELDLTGGASPRVAPFADLRDLGHLLQRAGLALPVTDIDRLTIRYDTLFDLARDLRTMGATNALQERSRKPLGRAVFLRAAERYAAAFADPDGRIRATFDIIWLSGWAPHESQQKPLRPGTAKMRLADVLGDKTPRDEGPSGKR